MSQLPHDFESPYTEQLERTGQAAADSEDETSQTEAFTATWPERMRVVRVEMRPRLESWLTQIAVLLKKIDTRRLRWHQLRLNRYYGATYYRQIAISARLRNIGRRLHIAVLWLWYHRWVIAIGVVALLLLFGLLYTLQWLIQNWAIVQGWFGDLWQSLLRFLRIR